MGDSGVPPGGSGAAPFAVTAPPQLSLGKDRSGRTSFTITNLTGRPVKARLTPRGQNGAADEWLSVAGPTEVPMAIASTLVAEVQVAVPPEASAGDCTLYLQVVAEDDTERVSGQSVSFTVPPPLPTEKKFPWLIVAIAAAIVVVVGGGLALLFLRDTEPAVADPVGTPTSAAPSNAPSSPQSRIRLPRNFQPPSINGSATVGKKLQALEGEWRYATTFAFQWVRCGTASLQTCTSIAGATGKTYLPVVADAGKVLRFRVTATNEGGTANSFSEPKGPVLAVVPKVQGLPLAAAIAVAKSAGLTVKTAGVTTSCPVVSKQSPAPGKAVPVTQVITVTLHPILQKC